MAKTKRKNKRNKRNKVYRKESCASRKTEEEIEKNSRNVLNMLDMLSPAITPSTPIFNSTESKTESSENEVKITECIKIDAGDSNNKTVESEISTTPKRISTYIQQKNMQNESKKSFSYFKTPTKQTHSCSCMIETPKIIISTASKITQSTPNFIVESTKMENNNNDIDVVIEKTPISTCRNAKSAQDFVEKSPFIKQTKSTPVFQQPSATKMRDISKQYFALSESPLIAKITTPIQKTPSVHNSTPMLNESSNYANNILSSKLKNVLKNEDKFNCIQEDISPILIPRNSMGTLPTKPLLVAQKLMLDSCETPVRKSITPKTKKNYLKYSLPIYRIYSWLQVLLKRSYTSLTRFLYGIRNQKSFSQECAKCLTCKEQIGALTNKITVLENELQTFKEEFKSIEELRKNMKDINEFKEQLFSSKHKSLGCVSSIQAPSYPPPPPPPPPPMPIFVPPPVTKPTKNSKKTDKGNENSRPLITVEDLLKVRLKKITSSTPINKKPPTLDADELLKQVKLRPMSRQAAPQSLSNSPTTSLTRILQNVDTNVRSFRRKRKANFLSVNDLSRSPSSRFRVYNDSAPVM